MLFPPRHRGSASCGVWGGRPLLQENHGRLPHARCPALPPAQASSPRPTHTPGSSGPSERVGDNCCFLPVCDPGSRSFSPTAVKVGTLHGFQPARASSPGEGPPRGSHVAHPSGPTIFLRSCCPGVAGALGRLLASVLPLGSICWAFAIRLGHVCLAGRQLTGAPVRGSRSGAVPPRGR